MKKITNHFLPAILLLLTACGSQTPKNDPEQGKDTATAQNKTVVNPAASVPAKRDQVRKEPVAQYRVKTDNPLNDWYFSVELYETPNTFQYLLKLQYEEIRGADTLKLPNFGRMPEPVIQKGPEKYSCIIGFKDKDDQFREYKKVYMKDGHLKVTALKHYGVSTYQP